MSAAALLIMKIVVLAVAVYLLYKMAVGLMRGKISSGPRRDGIVVEKKKNPTTFFILVLGHLAASVACVWWALGILH